MVIDGDALPAAVRAAVQAQQPIPRADRRACGLAKVGAHDSMLLDAMIKLKEMPKWPVICKNAQLQVPSDVDEKLKNLQPTVIEAKVCIIKALNQQ